MQRNAKAIFFYMKKLFFIGILSVLSLCATFAQVRFGVTAGLNASSFTGDVSDAKFKAGFQAGVLADLGISENFSIIPELLFSQRGYKYDMGSESVSTTLNYLQLPVNIAVKFDVGYGSKLFIFGGPYIGYGISANEVKFGSNNDEIKPLDFGVNVGLGYQFERVFFKLQFNPGLTNMMNENTGNNVTKNTNVAVTAGYFFN